jgi:alpha-beta hydrolase superfamily lysophospholipase
VLLPYFEEQIMVSSPAAQAGTLHRYSKRLIAFEHVTPSSQNAHNIILWAGGLGDGIHTVAYPAIVAQQLPAGWSLAQMQLLSSLNGWGTGSLQRDVKEIAQCVDYFRRLNGENSKIVVMGHSTGCQDVMEYVTGKGHEQRPKIDGAILQAPVSDREGLPSIMAPEAYKNIIETAEAFVREGRANDALPGAVTGSYLGRLPVSAYRWLSLLKEHGDDDYFSSDLPDEKLQTTFGAFPAHTPLLILFSGADEHVPQHVDVQGLVERWSKVVKGSQGRLGTASGVVPGAHHNLDEDSDDIVQELVRRVVEFAKEVDGSRSSKLS